MNMELQDIYGPPDWISLCCSVVSWGNLDTDITSDGRSGICSKCKDHASFKNKKINERNFNKDQWEIIKNLMTD